MALKIKSVPAGYVPEWWVKAPNGKITVPKVPILTKKGPTGSTTVR